MKKRIVFLVAVMTACLIAFTACSGDDNNNSATDPSASPIATDNSGNGTNGDVGTDQNTDNNGNAGTNANTGTDNNQSPTNTVSPQTNGETGTVTGENTPNP